MIAICSIWIKRPRPNSYEAGAALYPNLYEWMKTGISICDPEGS